MATQPTVTTAVAAAVRRKSGPFWNREIPMPTSAEAAMKAHGVASRVIQSNRSKPQPSQAMPEATTSQVPLRCFQPRQPATATRARQGTSQPVPACHERVKSKSSS